MSNGTNLIFGKLESYRAYHVLQNLSQFRDINKSYWLEIIWLKGGDISLTKLKKNTDEKVI